MVPPMREVINSNVIKMFRVLETKHLFIFHIAACRINWLEFYCISVSWKNYKETKTKKERLKISIYRNYNCLRMLNNKFYTIRAVNAELMNIGINIAFRYCVNMSDYRWKLPSTWSSFENSWNRNISHRNSYKN